MSAGCASREMSDGQVRAFACSMAPTAASGQCGVSAASTATQQDTRDVSSHPTRCALCDDRHGWAPLVCWLVRPPAPRTATFFRCTRTRGGRANRSPGAHAAGATRPGAARARANPAGGVGWTCAGAGAVCACDLGQILMIFYRKGFRVRAGRFQTCQIFRIDYWQKDMRNGPYFNTRQRP